MPKFVIEPQYLVPMYLHIVVEAETLEDACEKGIRQCQTDPRGQVRRERRRGIYSTELSGRGDTGSPRFSTRTRPRLGRFWRSRSSSPTTNNSPRQQLRGRAASESSGS
jgi:hypothetical protein